MKIQLEQSNLINLDFKNKEKIKKANVEAWQIYHNSPEATFCFGIWDFNYSLNFKTSEENGRIIQEETSSIILEYLDDTLMKNFILMDYFYDIFNKDVEIIETSFKKNSLKSESVSERTMEITLQTVAEDQDTLSQRRTLLFDTFYKNYLIKLVIPDAPFQEGEFYYAYATGIQEDKLGEKIYEYKISLVLPYKYKSYKKNHILEKEVDKTSKDYYTGIQSSFIKDKNLGITKAETHKEKMGYTHDFIFGYETNYSLNKEILDTYIQPLISDNFSNLDKDDKRLSFYASAEEGLGQRFRAIGAFRPFEIYNLFYPEEYDGSVTYIIDAFSQKAVVTKYPLDIALFLYSEYVYAGRDDSDMDIYDLTHILSSGEGKNYKNLPAKFSFDAFINKDKIKMNSVIRVVFNNDRNAIRNIGVSWMTWI